MATEAEKIKLIISNEFDTADITSEFSDGLEIVPSLPLSNLKLISRSKKCRTTVATASGTYTWSIQGTFNSSRPISGVAISKYLLNSSSTIRILLYGNRPIGFKNIQFSGDLVYDSRAAAADNSDPLVSPPPGWGSFLWGDSEISWGYSKTSTTGSLTSFFFSTVLAYDFKLEITSTLNVGDYMEISRIFMGEVISPRFNISYGHTLKYKEDTKQKRTYGGTLRSSQTSYPYREITFTFPTMLEDDRFKIFNTLYKTGMRKDILVSIYPEEVNTQRGVEYTMIGKFTKEVGFSEVYNKIYSTDSITIEEV